MAVPNTKVRYIDQSAITVTQDVPELDNRPLFFVVSSFDKGDENLKVISGQDFYDMYGIPTYARHGQNGIQAQRLINAGARLLTKRVCAEDATLANIVYYVSVASEEVQKTNANGDPIYLDEDGNETTEVTDNPVMINTASIKWNATSFENCKTFSEVEDAALELKTETVFPIFVYTENGRGVSNKFVRLTPNYQVSKNLGFMLYALNVYEGTTIIEPETISLNPEAKYLNTAYGLDNSSCYQVKGKVIPSVYNDYVDCLSSILDLDADLLKKYDLVYGYTNAGATIPNLSLDAESIDLNAINGTVFPSGDNGAFGTNPAGTTDWADAIRAVFAGEVTDRVWDVDEYKIAVVMDAAFPQVVKDAIANFVTWREDCVFFRDLGIGNYTFSDINEAYSKNTIKNKFIADYATSYTIKDPNTFKNIEVTMLYDMAACVVRGFNNGIINPLAGSYNGYILDSAIPDTLNFAPIITPAVNQKEAFEDLRLNYAIFQEGSCVVQSEYTSQDDYTELSYLNNIMGIQEVIRALRTTCPANRYRLVTGTDLSEYAKDCNTVLDKYRNNFYLLEFTYTEDPLQSMQKIFYASVRFAFNQFANAEVLDVYALNAANLLLSESQES